MDRTISEEELVKALIPGRIDAQLSELFRSMRRQVLTEAARRALQHVPRGTRTRISGQDIIEAARVVFEGAVDEFEQTFAAAVQSSHVRHAS